MHKIDQNASITVGIPVAATYRTATVVNGAAVDMAKFHNFAGFVIVSPETAWQGAITAVVAEGTTSTQFSTVYLATVTIASSTDTQQMGVVEISDTEMSDGYRYLRLQATPAAGTGNLFSAINCRFNPRYASPSD